MGYVSFREGKQLWERRHGWQGTQAIGVFPSQLENPEVQWLDTNK